MRNAFVRDQVCHWLKHGLSGSPESEPTGLLTRLTADPFLTQLPIALRDRARVTDRNSAQRMVTLATA